VLWFSLSERTETGKMAWGQTTGLQRVMDLIFPLHLIIYNICSLN